MKAYISTTLLTGLLTLIAFGATAQAGPRLATSVLSSDAVLNADQIKAVTEYVKFNTDKISSATSGLDISEARSQLISPMNSPLAKNPFINAYRAQVVQNVTSLLQHERVTVRMNAMIAVYSLRSIATVPHIETALKDNSIGVRYWGAKALNNLMGTTGTPMVNDAEQGRLLPLLQKVIADEESAYVLKHLYATLAKFTIAQAQTALLDLLLKRADNQKKKITDGISADFEGISVMQRQLFLLNARGTDVKPQLKKLTTITAKYMRVIANAMLDNKIKGPLLNEAMKFVRTADTIFPQALAVFDENAKPGNKMANAKPAAVMLALLTWVGEGEAKPGILTTSAIGIPYADIK